MCMLRRKMRGGKPPPPFHLGREHHLASEQTCLTSTLCAHIQSKHIASCEDAASVLVRDQSDGEAATKRQTTNDILAGTAKSTSGPPRAHCAAHDSERYIYFIYTHVFGCCGCRFSHGSCFQCANARNNQPKKPVCADCIGRSCVRVWFTCEWRAIIMRSIATLIISRMVGAH